MTSRRSFLGTLAAGVTAASAVPRVAAAAGKPPLGLQLWSVRNQLAKDVPGTLKQIKAWGFDEVESFGKFGAEIARRAEGRRPRGARRCTSASSDLAGRHGGRPQGRGRGRREDDHQPLPASQAEAAREPRGDPRRRVLVLEVGEGVQGGGQALRLPHPRPGVRPGARGDALRRAREGVGAGRRLRGGRLLGDLRRRRTPSSSSRSTRAACGTRTSRTWRRASCRLPSRPTPSPPTLPLGIGQIDIKSIVAVGAENGVEMNILEDESSDPIGNIPKSVAFYMTL